MARRELTEYLIGFPRKSDRYGQYITSPRDGRPDLFTNEFDNALHFTSLEAARNYLDLVNNYQTLVRMLTPYALTIYEIKTTY